MEPCAGFAGSLTELSLALFSKLFGGIFAGLDNSASIRFLPIAAFFANAVDLESVAGGDVTVFVSDLPLDRSDLLREKLDRSAALGTHHMMMTAAIVLMFVARDAVMKSNFARQSATSQKLQRPVDGGETDARIGFLDQPMQFVDRKMFTSFEEGPQNCVALFGLLQAHATKML